MEANLWLTLLHNPFFFWGSAIAVALVTLFVINWIWEHDWSRKPKPRKWNLFKVFENILAILAAISVTGISCLFMLNVFYNEAFLHQGVIYFEPNITIATVEFFTCLFGAILAVGILMEKLLQAVKEATQFRVEKNGKPL